MYTAPMPLPPGEFAPPRDEMAESTAIVVGTDLVQVSEVSKAMERFASAIFGGSSPKPSFRTAWKVPKSRRAASPRASQPKAALKVLRLTDQSFSWRSIEVARNPGGWCYLVLHGPMRLLPTRPVSWRSSLSMSHEGAYAQAVVVGQRRKTAGDEAKRPTVSS